MKRKFGKWLATAGALASVVALIYAITTSGVNIPTVDQISPNTTGVVVQIAGDHNKVGAD